MNEQERDSAYDRRTWTGRLALLLGGLATAYQALRIFYIVPWFGGATRLDRWFANYACVIPRLCGPKRLYLDHVGVLLVVVSALLFGLALRGQRGLFRAHDLPPLPGWASRPRRLRLAATLFALTGLAAILFQAYGVGLRGDDPQVPAWLIGSGALLVAGVIWDYADRADWRATASGMALAAGGALIVLAAGAIVTGGYRVAWLALAGLALIWLGVRLRPASVRASVAVHAGLALGAAILYLVLAMSRAGSWRIADVGDEWHFYAVAQQILARPALLRTPFVTHDPDGYHIMLSSGLQAAVMGITRADAMGWRLSSVLPVAWAIPGVYVFARWLGGRTLAWFSALLLAGAHVLLTFALIPYNNTQALLALGLGLGAAAWTMASPGVLRLLLTGMALGAGVLLHSLALAVMLPVYLLLIVQALPDWRRIGAVLGAVTAGMVAVASPLFFSAAHWRALMKATPVQSEVGQIYSPQVQIARNLVSGAFDFVVEPTFRMSHFVVGGRVDPLTAVLMIMGLAVTIVAVRRSRAAAGWLLAAAALLVSVSAVQQYGWVAITRSFILLPVYAVFAGIGGVALVRFLIPYSSQWRRGFLVLLAVAALALNQFHIDRISLPLSTDSWSEAAYVMRDLQAVAASAAPGQVIVLAAEPANSTLPAIAKAYGVDAYLAVADADNFVNGAVGCPLSVAPVVLLPASAGEPSAVRAYLAGCWDGVEMKTLPGPDGKPVFYRFTPTG